VQLSRGDCDALPFFFRLSLSFRAALTINESGTDSRPLVVKGDPHGNAFVAEAKTLRSPERTKRRGSCFSDFFFFFSPLSFSLSSLFFSLSSFYLPIRADPPPSE